MARLKQKLSTSDLMSYSVSFQNEQIFVHFLSKLAKFKTHFHTSIIFPLGIRSSHFHSYMREVTLTLKHPVRIINQLTQAVHTLPMLLNAN